MLVNLNILPVLSALIAFTAAAPGPLSTGLVYSDTNKLVDYTHISIPGTGNAEQVNVAVLPAQADTGDKNNYQDKLVRGTGSGSVDEVNGEGWGKVKCETSWASPTMSEIDGLIAKVYDKKNWKTCSYWQSNGGGSMCTQIAKSDGGNVSLCGRYKQGLACEDIIWAMLEVKSRCGNHGMSRAGGYYIFFQWNLRVVLH
ncbi:hypothetical protein BZA05DRAFT_441069 [Tricharina praecox]|uniref:uncharacterized protein n=1 Tax=Tricharina praecox TaxID=43433 RepID=UPI00221F6E8E|nr:uncharacterized protein BZA05DRAFT_441069 [Tricharina praecox]KAI5857763.1 hypothetical protein BZA05DRAFT_441069 [Tricharina praecox]